MNVRTLLPITKKRKGLYESDMNNCMPKNWKA